MISFKEAETFVNDILEMPKNWKYILETDKLNFISLYMEHHNTRIPFQNITMAAVDFDKRKHPSESELINQGLSGIGGVCINNNYFTKIVFESLGLHAFAVQGSYFSIPLTGTHCMTIVKVNETDLYLVELGGAYPIIVPVPLTKLPFRVLSAGGYPYEFREVSKGVIGKYHIGGGLLRGAYVDKLEKLLVYWDMTPRKFSEFDLPMQEMFTNPENSVILRSPMMCRYLLKKEIPSLLPQIESFSELNVDFQVQADTPFVFIFKKLLIIGDANTKHFSKHFETYGEMVVDIKTLFPKLQIKDIAKALEIFDRRLEPSNVDDMEIV